MAWPSSQAAKQPSSQAGSQASNMAIQQASNNMAKQAIWPSNMAIQCLAAFSGPTINREAIHTFKKLPVPMSHTGAEVPLDGQDALDWSIGGENWVNSK